MQPGEPRAVGGVVDAGAMPPKGGTGIAFDRSMQHATGRRHAGSRQRFGDLYRRALQQLEVLAVLPRYVRRVDWPEARMRAFQLARLRSMLAYAKQHSGFHRQRLAGVEPARLTWDDLGALPTMTKADLMAHYDDVLTTPNLTLARANDHIQGTEAGRFLARRYQVVTSAGSSGRRGVFIYDWGAWRTLQAANIRMAIRDALRTRRGLRFSTVAVIGAQNHWHLTRLAAEAFHVPPFVQVRPIPAALPLEQLVQRLNAIQPDTLAGYASLLPELAREARAGRLNIPLHRVVSTGEPLDRSARLAMIDVWGARVANTWATSECGPAASGCFAADGMHLSEDLVIVEPVDAGGRPVPRGERAAKVLLTNLYNTVLPLVRYELTDQVVMEPEPCPCGSPRARVRAIEGRQEDIFYYPNARIHPHVLRSPLVRDPAVTEYQVVQRPHGVEVRLRTHGWADIARIKRELIAAVEGAGLSGPEVVVHAVPVLHRGPGGKIKRFIPLSEADAPQARS